MHIRAQERVHAACSSTGARARLRVTRDSRGDTSVLLRIGDLQTEDGDVLLGGLY